MADIYEYIDSTGVIIADTADLLTAVQTEYKTAFGKSDLSVKPSTPQGALMTAASLSRDGVVRNNAELANQINPNYAGGIFLDAILALTGTQRVVQTRSTVASVVVTGVPSTTIPQGSQAKTDVGDIFTTTGDVLLDGSGNGVANFQSLAYGPIPCATGALHNIVSNVLGWETVNNPSSSAVLGRITQDDQPARATRKNTLAFQAVSLVEAITSALHATDGVKSLKFRENYTKTDTTIDGVFLLANSVYACVDGGTDKAVAACLLENKSSGSAWNGGASVTVTEPASGQMYSVSFDRPTLVQIVVRATIKEGTEANTIQAINDYANGLIDGEPGFVVGASVSPFELSGAINAEFPSIYVKKIEVSLATSISYSTDEIPIGINQKAVIQSITVVIVS